MTTTTEPRAAPVSREGLLWELVGYLSATIDAMSRCDDLRDLDHQRNLASAELTRVRKELRA